MDAIVVQEESIAVVLTCDSTVLVFALDSYNSESYNSEANGGATTRSRMSSPCDPLLSYGIKAAPLYGIPPVDKGMFGSAMSDIPSLLWLHH